MPKKFYNNNFKPNNRGDRDNGPTCAYCKNVGHLIGDCQKRNEVNKAREDFRKRQQFKEELNQIRFAESEEESDRPFRKTRYRKKSESSKNKSERS